MKCANCGVSVVEAPLMRINEMGIDGIFWCHSCTQKNEPELYNNLKEEESDIEKDLISIFYNKKINND